MGIDNLQLPDHLCQIMFANCLIDVSQSGAINLNAMQSPDTIKTIENSKISCLGQNEGNILFLVNNTQNKFIADDEMKLLSDLLTACNISMADIALVNYCQNPEINYQDLIDQFKSGKILIFGVTASDLKLPFDMPFFQIQKFQDQQYMISPNLSEFISNVSLKKELWNGLKKIFSLKK